MRHASKRAIRASIHASAREATLPGPQAACAANCFNPRLRTGGDPEEVLNKLKKALVSIHASAREATIPIHKQTGLPSCFNPRLRTGGDSESTALDIIIQRVSIHASAREATLHFVRLDAQSILFQSTPPHGRRLFLSCGDRDCSTRFNPRLRTGGDVLYRRRLPTAKPVSIHASAREAT